MMKRVVSTPQRLFAAVSGEPAVIPPIPYFLFLIPRNRAGRSLLEQIDFIAVCRYLDVFRNFIFLSKSRHFVNRFKGPCRYSRFVRFKDTRLRGVCSNLAVYFILMFCF